MKKLFYTLSLVALVAGASAFTISLPKTVQTEQRYVFQGSTTEQALIASNWEMVDIEDDAPGCVNGTLPCYVETSMTIDQWLAEKDEETVVFDANGKRN